MSFLVLEKTTFEFSGVTCKSYWNRLVIRDNMLSSTKKNVPIVGIANSISLFAVYVDSPNALNSIGMVWPS